MLIMVTVSVLSVFRAVFSSIFSIVNFSSLTSAFSAGVAGQVVATARAADHIAGRSGDALGALIGVLAQYLLTLGFRFVTAVEGSVISSTRILLAALLGPLLLGEPSLGMLGLSGALLIFFSNVYLAWRKIS